MIEIRKFNIYKTIDFFAVLLYYRGRRKSYEINLSLVWRKRLYSAKLHKADTGYYGGVTAVYDEPVGNVWSVEKLEKLKNLAAAAYTIPR